MGFFYDLKSAFGKRIDYGFSIVVCFFGAQDELRPFLAIMGMVSIVSVGLVDGEGQEVDQFLFFGYSHIGRIAPPYRHVISANSQPHSYALPFPGPAVGANIAKLPERKR
jgi:hypothetical protein